MLTMKTKINFFVAGFLLAGASSALVEAHDVHVNGVNCGGGSPPMSFGDDISAAQQAQVESNIAKNLPATNGPHPPDLAPAPYPFVPIAGTLWQDRFVLNFVDLDSTSPGILDWDCTDYTVDGHTGHDILLHSFGEQDVGVPVFAALDGVVADMHDGDYDRNTVMNNQPSSGNYVVLLHQGTHYSEYWKLRSNSIPVSIGQFVRAGTQIGLVGSSGNSSWPHLHFGSQNNGVIYEPSAGGCRPGHSGWVNQIPIRRDMYIDNFAMHNTNNFPAGTFLPYNPSRTGTIVRTGAGQPIGAWYILHNQPANSNWRVRYLRPDASLFFDSGLQFYGNPFSRFSFWYFSAFLNPDISGAWTLELSINGQVVVAAPFTVLDVGGVPTNRPPKAVLASFDPPWPGTNDVVFCRLTVPLLEDPDYDLTGFRFQWRTNGVLFRDTTNAACSDAVPATAATAPTLLSCTVTPFDGTAFGPSTVAQTVVGPQVVIRIASAGPGQVSLHWPTSSVPYVPEWTTNLVAPMWTPLTNYVGQSLGENVTTGIVSGASQFFRLRWP
jgi:hypothetical protein